ncbi:MAG: type II secretion system protein GspE, partial [Deltaproteobacteria bacterium]|nr:type II secretion system protein GspE [Deltaproteobacteria bacterium]
MTERIGELLLRAKLITQDQLLHAVDEQKKTGGRLGVNLTKLGHISEKDLTSFLSKQYGVPSVDLASMELDPEVCKLIPENVCKKNKIIAIERNGATLVVAMADPSNIGIIDDIKFRTNYNVESVVASEVAIMDKMEDAYAAAEMEMDMDDVLVDFDEDEMEVVSDEDDVDLGDLKKGAEDAPVVKI